MDHQRVRAQRAAGRRRPHPRSADRPRPGTALTEQTGYLGLGSNEGDRRGHLEAAVDALPGHGVAVVASSSVYETEPVGEVLDQREFFNACIRVQTALAAEPLLAACKAVERELGRAPGGIRHGPRPIDVDLLLLDELELRTGRLTLPHPEVLARRFVLVPLLELDPGISLPGGERLADALAGLGGGQAVRRAGPPLTSAHAPGRRRR